MGAAACPRCGEDLNLVISTADKETPRVASLRTFEPSATACPHCGDSLRLEAGESPRRQGCDPDLSAPSDLRNAATRALANAEPSAARAVGIVDATRSAEILASDAGNPSFSDSDLRAAAPALGRLHTADQAWDDADRALAAAMDAINDVAALQVLDRKAVLKALADARAELETVKEVRSLSDTHLAVWASQIGKVVHRDIRQASFDVGRALATTRLADALEAVYGAVGDINRRVTARVEYADSDAKPDWVAACAADLINALASANSAAKRIAEVRMAWADTFVDLREALAAAAFAARGVGRQVGEIPSAPVAGESSVQDDPDLLFEVLEYQSVIRRQLDEESGPLTPADADTALVWSVRRGLDTLDAADQASAELAAISSESGLFRSTKPSHFKVDSDHFIALHTLDVFDQSITGTNESGVSYISVLEGRITSEDISAAYAELAAYTESSRDYIDEKAEDRKCVDCGLDISYWDRQFVRCVGCAVPHEFEYRRRREVVIEHLASAIARKCALCGAALRMTKVPHTALRAAALAMAGDNAGNQCALTDLDRRIEIYINSPSAHAAAALSKAALSLALIRYEKNARVVDALCALDPHREWYGDLPVHAGVYESALARALARDAALFSIAETSLVDSIKGRCEACSDNLPIPPSDLSPRRRAPSTSLSKCELGDSISPDDLPF